MTSPRPFEDVRRAMPLVLALTIAACSRSSVAAGPPPSSDAGMPDAPAMTDSTAVTEAGGNTPDALPTDDGAFAFYGNTYDASFLDTCYPDGDGINGGSYTFDLTVTDTGFSKLILATQNDAQATVVLTNKGAQPHGFQVGCANVTPSYPMLPAGCPVEACFSGATMAPIAPGATMTITFDTPTPDGLIYPFRSTDPADVDVPGLNSGQWSLM